MTSTITTLVQQIVSSEDPQATLASVLSELTPIELCHLWYDWDGMWCRDDQRVDDGDWSSFGMIGGKGSGKTRAIAQYVHREAMSGRAMRIGLAAQGEDEAYDIQVAGDSGLITIAPPWERPQWVGGRLLWPNGAQAFIYTPNEPGNVHGPQHHLFWLTELHEWPRSKIQEFWRNLRMGLRLGYARLVWDTNPAKRHPLIRSLVARSQRDPLKHVVVRSATRDNVDNLNPDRVREWEEDYAGTEDERMYLLGLDTDDADGASWQQEWIDRSRAMLPAKVDRWVLSIDPACSTRKGTDDTGMVLGAGAAGHAYVVEDLSAHYGYDEWGDVGVDVYFTRRCDCIVIERNRLGDGAIANIRAAARKYSEKVGRHIAVVSVGASESVRHDPSTIFVREVVGRSSKEARAEPAALSHKNGKVHHVVGANLSELEEEQCTFVGGAGADSPNRMDAMVWLVWEILGLGEDKRDGKADVRAAAKVASMMHVGRPIGMVDALGIGRRRVI